jgi:hypothetical protein
MTIVRVREARLERSGEGRKSVGKTKDFGEEYRGCSGIFIVLDTINNSCSLEPLLIICRLFRSGSSYEPMLISDLSVVQMNHY